MIPGERILILTDEWHEGTSTVSLHEYLKMTLEEYKSYVESSVIPKDWAKRFDIKNKKQGGFMKWAHGECGCGNLLLVDGSKSCSKCIDGYRGEDEDGAT